MPWKALAIGTATFTAIFVKLPAKQRPRKGKNGFYTPKETEKAEDEIATLFLHQVSGETDFDFPNFDGEVRASIEIQRSLSKSASKMDVGKPDLTKPDIDNVLKIVLDALNGVAYKDDKQITHANITKLPLVEHREFVTMIMRFTYYRTERV